MMTSGIIGALPTLLNVAAWIVAITFAVRMVRGVVTGQGDFCLSEYP